MPSPTKMTRVSLVYSRNRAEAVKRAVTLLKINPVKGKAVALKPNFNSADIAPGSTHIDTLRALILQLKEMGASKITVAERSGPGKPTRQVMEEKGIFKLAEEIGFEILNMEEMSPEGWVHVTPKDSHWPDGFLFPRIYREAESIVTTCCLKTHQFGGHFTLSMKLSVGMVPGGLGPNGKHPFMNQLHRSNFQRQMIAEINTAYKPDLVVLDGVDAFVDGGPATGKKVEANVMLAGTDRVAVDAVAVSILRVLGTNPTVSKGKVFEQDQIARAVDLGLGVNSPEQIELVTDDAAGADFAVKVKTILMHG